MKRISTNTTFESFAFPVSFADVSASGAGLACEVAVDENNSFANHFSFVFDKVEKHCWTPASNEASCFFVFCSSFSHLHCSNIQFFQSNCITIAINYFFADAVICVNDKPSLSSSQFLQMSFCGTSACSLQASLEMPVFSFDCSQLFTVEKMIVGSDCGIIYSSVNPDDFIDFHEFRCFDVCDDIEYEFAFIHSDSCRCRFLELVSGKVRWYSDCVFSPACDCGQANLFTVAEEFESVVIQHNRAFQLFDRFLFEFESLEHCACLVSDSSHETAVEQRIFCSDSFVCEMMKPVFVVSFVIDTFADDVSTGLISHSDCVGKCFISVHENFDCDVHIKPYKHNIFKYVVFSKEHENQENKTLCLQYQLSSGLVSKIQKASSCRRNQNLSGADNHWSLSRSWLGFNQLVSSARPYPYIHFSSTDILSHVCCEGSERSYRFESYEEAQICEKVLESELLRWDCWDGDRTDNSEVYSRTRTEVRSQFPTASRMQCPLAT